MSVDIGVWLAAFCTLGLFSWMYKENPWFRLCEHMYVGASLGQLATAGLDNVRSMCWGPLMQGKTLMLLPLLGGLLLYSRWFKGWGYLSRIPMGFIMGTTSAVVITGAIKSNFIDQIMATMLPLTSVNNIIFVVLTLCGTFYFVFSAKGNWTGPITDVGKYSLMVAFGSAFGTTVMSRISLFVGRMQFLLTEWIHVIK